MESTDSKHQWGSHNGYKERSHATTSTRIARISPHSNLEHGERFQYHQQPLVRISRLHAARLWHITQVFVHFLLCNDHPLSLVVTWIAIKCRCFVKMNYLNLGQLSSFLFTSRSSPLISQMVLSWELLELLLSRNVE